jgi:hypothetical protein
MPPYKYSPLNVSGEIRLLMLLPRSHDEPIHFNIFHTPFVVPEKDLVQRDPATDKIQGTLPPHWTVRWTLEGDIIFYYEGPNGVPHRSSRTHSDTGFDCSIL